MTSPSFPHGFPHPFGGSSSAPREGDPRARAPGSAPHDEVGVRLQAEATEVLGQKKLLKWKQERAQLASAFKDTVKQQMPVLPQYTLTSKEVKVTADPTATAPGCKVTWAGVSLA